MEHKNKKENNNLPIIALGAGALFYLFSKSKNEDVTKVNNQASKDTDKFLDEVDKIEFSENNGVSSAVGSDIIPFIVPSSFVIKPEENKFYYWDYSNSDDPQKIYIPGAKISFLVCIHVPTTSIGSLKIEDVLFDDIKIVRYIDDLHQEWIEAQGADKKLLENLGKKFKGKTVYTGYNLFEISFYVYPKLNEIEYFKNLPYFDFEAISIGFNVKYEETRLTDWRMLSAWNIMEDSLTNEGTSLGSNTRFGVVRNYESKPREQRGLFSEWWADYVAAGYNTTINKIEVLPNSYLIG